MKFISEEIKKLEKSLKNEVLLLTNKNLKNLLEKNINLKFCTYK